MALLGENAQCNDNFPRYYSTRELIFDSEDSTWTTSNVNNELRTDSYHMGPFPLSSPCTLLGYNQELVKQTILKHEAIFKDQIRELHRVYYKQRELMDEIKRSELHKQNVRLEASWSSSTLSSKNTEKIICSPNLPWSASQSRALFAESIQLPLASAQEKPLESKYRKVGKKILDLELPAYAYIDSDEGEESERVTEVPKVSVYSLNGVSQVLCDIHDKPHRDSSGGFANANLPFKLDLNVPFSLEVETAAKSCDMDDLSCFCSSHQINREPWTKRKFSSSESSAQTRCPRSSGLLGAMGLPCLKENKISAQIESSDLQSFQNFATELFQNQSKNQRIEEIEKGCVSDVKSPSTDASDLGKLILTGVHLIENEKKPGFLAGIIDLNSSMIEDENMPIDVDLHAPASPENKECLPPRGESDENQLVTPFQSAEQGDVDVQEEQTRIAAEALVSISGFAAKKDIQNTNCSSSESFANSPLHWFAGIVSTTEDLPENDNTTDFNGKVNNLEEFLSDEMDYFEFMTLNLAETKDLYCHCKSTGHINQIGGSASPTQPRKSVRMNRGRWRKDFQSEILPSLTSLSRYEVTEDLKTIGSLVTTGTHSETGSLRSASRNVLSRGRKRSCTSTSNTKDTDMLLNLKQLTSISKLGIEKKSLISWGKTCKKRRGQRFRISNPWFIWRQVNAKFENYVH